VPVQRSVPTGTHGRVLTEDAADSFSGRLLVIFHGYKQSADDALEEARRIPGVAATWRVVSVQALHRFYSSGQKVVASWMTRQDRDEAIEDNVAYVDRVVAEQVDSLPPGSPHPPAIVFMGFSQGASMAYRAAVLGRHPARGVIALAGDIPPELKMMPGGHPQRWPPVLIGAGTTESYFTPERVAEDVAFLESQGVTHEVCRFEGGHEWTDEFRSAAGRWLEGLG
jgi:predicted esterase